MEHKYDNSIVYNADCMEIMRGIADGYFDLAVVDPPYGIGYDGAKQTSGSHGGRKAHNFKGWDANIPDEEYFIELKRISKNQIVWGANYMVRHLDPGMGWIIWRKDRGNFSSSDAELAYTSFNRALREYTKNHLVLVREGGTIHPTQKPICLYDWIYANYLPQGGKVFDSHLGSQSNRISAYKRGNIDFTACELDKDYFNDGNARFMEFVKKYQPAHLEPITANGQNKLF